MVSYDIEITFKRQENDKVNWNNQAYRKRLSRPVCVFSCHVFDHSLEKMQRFVSFKGASDKKILKTKLRARLWVCHNI